MDTLINAHKNAMKGKKHYKEVKDMQGYEQYYLKELQNRLVNQTYKTSEYTIEKINDDGKERIIYKLPYFPDRIAQWAIMLIIEPMLKEKLILDTYSAIPNRGIHFGLKRLHKSMEDKEETKYCLKLDIKKYYPSINHSILKNIYRKIFKDPKLLWLLDEIVDSTKGEIGLPDMRECDVATDIGIPIGNYISQWSGNIYLAYFDHWCKETLKCKHYFRYMDDIVILHKNKKHLHNIKRKLDKYLKNNLDLTIKGNWQVFPTYKRGVDFLGYRSFGDYTLLRKSTAKKFKRKMRNINKKERINFNDYCSINSYLGWLKWCNSYNLKQKYIKPLKDKILNYENRNNIKNKTKI